MKLTVGGLNLIICNMSIDLGSADIAVAEHHLYRAEVRAIREQRCRETVTEHVRGNIINPGHPAVVLNELPELLPRHSPATPVDKQFIGTGIPQQASARGQIEIKIIEGRASDRHTAFLAPLTKTVQHSQIEVQVSDP